MEERFVTKSTISLKKQIRTNKQELRSLQILVMLVVIAATAIAVYTLIEKGQQSSIEAQDIYNIVLTVIMLLIILFLPHLTSMIQMMTYQLRHIGNQQTITVENQSFHLHREEGPDVTIPFESVTRVIERDSHIKVTSGIKVIYLQKEDFTEGEPKALMKYLAKTIE